MGSFEDYIFHLYLGTSCNQTLIFLSLYASVTRLCDLSPFGNILKPMATIFWANIAAKYFISKKITVSNKNLLKGILGNIY